MESKQPIPSVIARLMGLDEPSYQQPVHKKARVLSENYIRRVASIGVREKCPGSHPFRLSVEEQKEYKDVFRVLETLKREKHHSMSPDKSGAHWISSNVNTLYTGQKFSEAKCFSADKKHQSSKECHDTPEVIDSINESCLLTTRIVVLKPNLGKAENATSCHEVSCSGDRKYGEILTHRSGNLLVELKERKKLASGMGITRLRSRFSKDRSRKMRLGMSIMSAEESRARIRGCNGSFAKESGLTIPLHVLSDRKNQFYHSDGSYVAMEAKKQIHETWKTTKKFQQVELASRGKTLGEMLAIPNPDSRSNNLDYKSDKCGLSNQVSLESRDVNFGTPLSIGSWERLKDGQIRDLPRFRSHLVNYKAVKSPNKRMSHESFQNGRCMRVLESINVAQKKLRKQDSDQKDGSECIDSDFVYENSSPTLCLELEKNHSVEANYVFLNQLENKLGKDSCGRSSVVSKSLAQNNQTLQETWATQRGNNHKGRDGDLSEQNSAVPKSAMSNVSSVSMEANMVVDTETEVAKLMGSPLNHEEQHLEPKHFILSIKDEDSSFHILDTSIQQDIFHGNSEGESVSSHCSGTDPESVMSLEEVYQPSPNSVLEPLCKGDFSSSFGCSKALSVSLHGLNMQFEFLKSQTSDAYSEGSGMMVSSDEDNGEGSVCESEENEDLVRSLRVEESRDFSYLVDVLTEAGLHTRNLHMGFDTWHSTECPISVKVFETLEKKYGEQVSWKRSERRLLFDCINSGLMEILQPSMGVPAWTKSVVRRLNLRQGQEAIEEELWMFLVKHKKGVSRDSQKFLGQSDRWWELGDDIQIIGREIEDSLVDELLTDVVSMERF